MDIASTKLQLLQTDTALFLEGLNYYVDMHPELISIISKLSTNDFQITDKESDLIWTTMSNYYPLLNGTKKRKVMHIAVCFDPYARELAQFQKP